MFQFRRFPTYAYGFCICYMDISPCFFFFNDTATTEIYTLVDTLSLHDALPIYGNAMEMERERRKDAGKKEHSISIAFP